MTISSKVKVAESGARRTLIARWWKADRNVNQDRAEVQGGADAVRQELETMRERMAVIKQEVAAEVDQKWGSPFRTQEVFDLKVKSRLSGNDEYRTLQRRVQDAEAADAEAALAAESGTATEAGSAS